MSWIKYIHTADTHNGYDGNASLHNEFNALKVTKMTEENINVRTHDVNMAFKQVIDLAIQHKVDFVVHAGDGLNKHGYKNPHIYNFYMEQVSRLYRHGIHYVEIAGNHNFAKKAGVGNELFKLGLLEGVHTVYRGFYETVELPHLNTVCHCVPSTFDQRILNEELEKVTAVEGKYNIGIGHFGVAKLPQYARNADRTLVVSLEQLKRCGMDTFCLGDFHTDVDFGDGIRYSGATERFCLGEIKNAPKVYLVEANTETRERKETPLFLNVRKMFDLPPIDASDLSSDAISERIQESIKGTDVRDAIVRLTVSNVPKHLMSPLRLQEDLYYELAKEALYFKLDLRDKTELSKLIRTGTDVEFEGILEGFHAFMERVGEDASYDKKTVTALGEDYLKEELDIHETH